MINWKVRVKNPVFWRSFVPALILAIQAIAAIFGLRVDLGAIGEKIIAAIDAIFGVLVVLGVVIDPTTSGTGDSQRALAYQEPHNDPQN